MAKIKVYSKTGKLSFKGSDRTDFLNDRIKQLRQNISGNESQTLIDAYNKEINDLQKELDAANKESKEKKKTGTSKSLHNIITEKVLISNNENEFIGDQGNAIVNLEPDARVFICGCEVSDITNIKIENMLWYPQVQPTTCSITIFSPENRYILFKNNIEGVWNDDEETKRYIFDLKRLSRISVSEGECIFGVNDPVIVFLKDRFTSFWRFGFVGYVSKTDDLQAYNRQEITLECEDITKFIRMKRYNINPGLIDPLFHRNAISRGIQKTQWTQSPMSGSTPYEAIKTIFFGINGSQKVEQFSFILDGNKNTYSTNVEPGTMTSVSVKSEIPKVFTEIQSNFLKPEKMQAQTKYTFDIKQGKTQVEGEHGLKYAESYLTASSTSVTTSTGATAEIFRSNVGVMKFYTLVLNKDLLESIEKWYNTTETVLDTQVKWKKQNFTSQYINSLVSKTTRESTEFTNDPVKITLEIFAEKQAEIISRYQLKDITLDKIKSDIIEGNKGILFGENTIVQIPEYTQKEKNEIKEVRKLYHPLLNAEAVSEFYQTIPRYFLTEIKWNNRDERYEFSITGCKGINPLVDDKFIDSFNITPQLIDSFGINSTTTNSELNNLLTKFLNITAPDSSQRKEVVDVQYPYELVKANVMGLLNTTYVKNITDIVTINPRVILVIPEALYKTKQVGSYITFKKWDLIDQGNMESCAQMLQRILEQTDLCGWVTPMGDVVIEPKYYDTQPWEWEEDSSNFVSGKRVIELKVKDSEIDEEKSEIVANDYKYKFSNDSFLNQVIELKDEPSHTKTTDPSQIATQIEVDGNLGGLNFDIGIANTLSMWGKIEADSETKDFVKTIPWATYIADGFRTKINKELLEKSGSPSGLNELIKTGDYTPEYDLIRRFGYNSFKTGSNMLLLTTHDACMEYAKIIFNRFLANAFAIRDLQIFGRPGLLPNRPVYIRSKNSIATPVRLTTSLQFGVGYFTTVQTEFLRSQSFLGRYGFTVLSGFDESSKMTSAERGPQKILNEIETLERENEKIQTEAFLRSMETPGWSFAEIETKNKIEQNIKKIDQLKNEMKTPTAKDMYDQNLFPYTEQNVSDLGFNYFPKIGTLNWEYLDPEISLSSTTTTTQTSVKDVVNQKAEGLGNKIEINPLHPTIKTNYMEEK